jgi:hypothetical protein
MEKQKVKEKQLVLRQKRGACGVFSEKNMKERDHLEDEGIDGLIILKWFFNMLESVDWILQAQDMDHLRTLVNAVI